MTTEQFQQSIGFLIAQVCKAHRGSAETLLNEVGLHAGQEMFLMRLWEAEGQTQSQLAGDMCIQPPTVNKMVSRMEAAGLVRREGDPDDSRISRIYLTAEGQTAVDQVEAVWAELEARTLANLTPDERVLLRRLLLQVQANLTSE
jgi:MarR family transcriptional regulator, organic hydroperoxide resistance regulator